MTSPATPTTTTPERTETVTPPPAPAGEPAVRTHTGSPATVPAAAPAAAPAAGPAEASTDAPADAPTDAPADAPTDAPTDRASAKAEMADVAPRARRSPDVGAGARRAAHLTGAGIARLRTLLAEIAWLSCLLAATALLLGAVLVVLDANTRNALVVAVLRAADWADLGVFSRTAGVKQFSGDNAVVKNTVTNWGLAAVAWLVVGRVARRILTP